MHALRWGLLLGVLLSGGEAAWAVERESAAPAVVEVPAGQGVKGWLRRKVVRPEDMAHFGLRLDDGFHRADRAAGVVVLVHGFNSTPERNLDLAAPLQQARLPLAWFCYPNDQALADSSELLSRELNRFARQHPDRRVALLTHSMGGLIARACLENPALDPGNVERLVMIAPPNHGSLLAYFAAGTDLWEHGWHGSGGPIQRFRASLADGVGEAQRDLRPGSEFLHALNARERNGQVQYSIVLGTGGRMSARQLTVARTTTRYAGRCIPFGSERKKRLDEVLADLDEVVQGKGDGAVAVKRGRLQGVDDVLLLSFSHLGETPDDEGVAALHAAVLKRLNGAGR